MISAAGIKDQGLTLIVSMMLIELALLRLSRFKRLSLLDTQGLELLVALHPRVWWGDAGDAYMIGLVTMLALSAAYNICFVRQVGSAPLRPLRDAGLGSTALADLQLVSRTCR
jgi:hypothetical protein